MEKNIVILLDYANIVESPNGTQSSVCAIVDKLLDEVLDAKYSYRFLVRLYGGWDELEINEVQESREARSKISRLAENVLEILPTETIRYKKMHLIKIELARSLYVIPHLTLGGTYRQKQISYKLVLGKKDEICCDGARKQYDFLHALIKKRRCLFCRAPVRYLSSSEQKLVDSLMCVDAMSIAKEEDTGLVVVSDDDDFIPVLISIASGGRGLIHVRKNWSPTCNMYIQEAKSVIKGFGARYKGVQL
jgi:uncharacterized LabA/DUF88 family protein